MEWISPSSTINGITESRHSDGPKTQSAGNTTISTTSLVPSLIKIYRSTKIVLVRKCCSYPVFFGCIVPRPFPRTFVVYTNFLPIRHSPGVISWSLAAFTLFYCYIQGKASDLGPETTIYTGRTVNNAMVGHYVYDNCRTGLDDFFLFGSYVCWTLLLTVYGRIEFHHQASSAFKSAMSLLLHARTADKASISCKPLNFAGFSLASK